MNSSRLPGKDLCAAARHALAGPRGAAFAGGTGVPANGFAHDGGDHSNSADDATATLCGDLQIDCFRGSEEDVLAPISRPLRASATSVSSFAHRGQSFVLPCPHCEDHSSSLRRRSRLHQHRELVLRGSGSDASRCASRHRLSPTSTYCREHVTPYSSQHPDEFRVVQLPPTWSGLRPNPPHRRYAGGTAADGSHPQRTWTQATVCFPWRRL